VGDWLAKYEKEKRAGMTSAERPEDCEDGFRMAQSNYGYYIFCFLLFAFMTGLFAWSLLSGRNTKRSDGNLEYSSDGAGDHSRWRKEHDLLYGKSGNNDEQG
jgi:hypothetical protein